MTSAPIAAETVVPKPSLIARGIGFFSGTVGLAIKLVLLGAVNALAIWALAVLFGDGKWLAALLIGAATVLIDAVYLVPDRRLVPLKYLVPGTVFLVAFVVIPILSNVNIAFTNWSTLHNLSKDEAIAAIEERSLVAPADAASYTSTPAMKDGELVSAGGRVLSICATDPDLAGALRKAYTAVERVDWPGKVYRRDIGRRVLERGERANAAGS